MTENKTKATDASVGDYIASRAQAQQGKDCHALMALLEQLTGQPAKMWGPSIVGYGSYSYTYDSGRSGEAPLTGFAIRGRDLVLYLSVDSEEQQALLARLGKHSQPNSFRAANWRCFQTCNWLRLCASHAWVSCDT